MSKEKIVAAIVDTQLLTLYRLDGSSIEIAQGDPRVARIVEEILPVLNRHDVAEVDLQMPNSYREFEEKTQGFVRFFRVAKDKIKHLFTGESVEDADRRMFEEERKAKLAPTGEYGTIPNQLNPVVGTIAVSRYAVDEIMKHATPVNDDRFKTIDTTNQDTMVAVVTNPETNQKTAIPGVEAIHDQFQYAARQGSSTKGVEAFISRLAAIIDKREHSVNDLLRFMERGDLPIADDGSIIAYKVLTTKGVRDLGDSFFDCYSKKIPQKIGSYVCMEEDLLSKSRSTQCAHGLHIARRGYLKNFSGNVMTLCKIDPEDVIVVPTNEPDKMRVKGYHILFRLDANAADKLRQNLPMTDNKGAAALLARAISGDHPPRIEMMKITEANGEKFVVTPLLGRKAKTENPNATIPVGKASALDDPLSSATHVDPKDIDRRASTMDYPRTEAPTTTVSPGGVRQKAVASLREKLDDQSAYLSTRIQAALDLLDFRKKAKVSWEKMDHPDLSDEILRSFINSDGRTPTSLTAQVAKKLNTPPPVPVIAPVAKAPKPKQAKRAEPQAKPLPPVKAKEPSKLGLNTRQGNARLLYERQKWGPLLDFKQRAKVSWENLGFNSVEIEIILDKIPKGNPK